MNNLNIEQFHQDLIQFINNYNHLPISVIYYIMKDCLYEIKSVYQQVLEQEQQEQSQGKDCDKTVQ